MSSGVEVIVAGHVCLDILPELSSVGREPFEEAFQPGRVVLTGPASFSPGGAVPNTSLALVKIGIPTKLVGMVGNDLFGQATLNLIASHGEDLINHLVITPSSSTSYTIVINYPGTDRILLHYKGTNDLFQANVVPEKLLNQAGLFHFGYPPVMRRMYLSGGAQMAELLQRAKNCDITTSLDMSLPDPASEASRVDWRAFLLNVLPLVDIFFPSVEEILIMLRPDTYQDMRQLASGSDILPLITPELLSSLSHELITMGASMVGLKLGYRGLYLRTGDYSRLNAMGRAKPQDTKAWTDRELWAPCFQVVVKGTTGSGDATIAGFLSGLLHGQAIEEALTSAVAVGACNVEAVDALSGIQSWESTQRRIAAGWKRQLLDLVSPGWQFDPTWSQWYAA